MSYLSLKDVERKAQNNETVNVKDLPPEYLLQCEGDELFKSYFEENCNYKDFKRFDELKETTNYSARTFDLSVRIGGTSFRYSFRKVILNDFDDLVKRLEKLELEHGRTEETEVILNPMSTKEENIKMLLDSGIKTRKEIRNQFKINRIIPPGDRRLDNAIKNYPEIVIAKIGRPSIIQNDHLKQIIEKKVKKTPHMKIKDIQFYLKRYHNYELSCSSINRILHAKKFTFKKPPIIQCLDKTHLVKRKHFVDKERKRLRIEYQKSSTSRRNHIKHIYFSDESRICINNDCNKSVWIQRGCNCDNICNQKVQHPKGIMIFGCIGFNYKSKLIYCDKNIDAKEYINILKQSGLIKELRNKRNRIFMQDNAPSHNSKLVVQYLIENDIQTLKWPPRSCDLNPIEQLWDYIKKKVSFDRFDDELSMFDKCIDVWETIPLKIINKYINSYERRIKLCYKNNYKSISRIMIRRR